MFQWIVRESLRAKDDRLGEDLFRDAMNTIQDLLKL
jgi:hypothetical protein